MKLSMSSVQSLHNKLKNDITDTHRSIESYSKLAQQFYQNSIPDTENGKWNFEQLNKCRDQIRILKEMNKKMAKTSVELKNYLRDR